MVVPTTSPPVFFESPKNLKVHDKKCEKTETVGGERRRRRRGAERKRVERCEVEEAEARIEDNDVHSESETIDCNQDR